MASWVTCDDIHGSPVTINVDNVTTLQWYPNHTCTEVTFISGGVVRVKQHPTAILDLMTAMEKKPLPI